MAKKSPEPTLKPRERAFLVGTEIFGDSNLLSLSDSLAELSLLADTAGLDVVGETTQKLSRPNPKFFIGPGKVEEVKLLAEEVKAEVILFDDELKSQEFTRVGKSARR